jgi:uncharacterized protein YecT (DUF1311 family)
MKSGMTAACASGAATLLLAAGLAGPGAAQTSTNCTHLTAQIDIDFCSRDGWEIADRELNRLWGIVKPAADQRGMGQALLDEQRAWLRFRDATCEGERDAYAGGSIAPTVYWQCMDRLTLERNAALRALR